MKKNLLFIAAFIFVNLSAICLQSCKDKSDAIPALLERKAKLGTDDERTNILTVYNKAVEALKKNPDDLQQYVNLASVYVTEGRVTGNSYYYGNAGMKMLNKVIESNTANKDIVFQALSIKSAILLNMHQFKDALETAKQGEALNQFNSGIYGALVDANVEMGNYDEAVKDCDKMIAIRPDLRSYSRASYLRQIFGQNAGAMDAMKMAVEAGMPGAENTEWARTTLGDLYLNYGNPDSASIIYRTSLVYRPSYPYALMGMARVEKTRKNYDAAINYTKDAIKVLSETAFVSFLADLYELKGDMAKAKETRGDVIDLLKDGQKQEEGDALVRHNVNRELAMASLNYGNLDQAIQYARNDLEMRPGNIDANELAAWIYYLKGDRSNAKICADKMLTTNSKNPATLYKAGLIYLSAGVTDKGRQLMSDAVSISPYIDQHLLDQSKQVTLLTKN